jgi:DHA1 family tetracycline resistance protein-like MFS transporter
LGEEAREHARVLDEEFQTRIAKYDISAEKILPIVVISVIVDMLGYIMVMPLLPFYAQSFGASDFMVGIIISMNAVTSLVMGPVWGRLSDKYGRKPILLVSQAGTLASFMVLAVSSSTLMLIASRLLDGLFGGQIPVINATITDVTAPQTRAEKMAVMAISMTVGSIVGPMIGGYLGGIDLAYPAYAACVMSCLAILASLVIFKETMPPERRQDLRRIMEERVGEEKRLVLSRTVLLRLAQVFAMTFMFGTVFSSMSLVLNKRYGADPTEVGSVSTVMGVFTFIYGGLLLRRAKERVGEQRLLLVAICLSLTAFTIMPVLPTFISFYLFIAVFSAGSNFGRPILSANLTRAVDEDKQGLVSGYSTTVNSIARAIAPLVSTGWLELGGLTVGFLFVNKYYMIAVTGFTAGLLFLLMYLVDQRTSTF